MIRINLLAPERPTAKKKAAASTPGALQAYLFLLLFGGGAIAGCVALYAWKTSQLAELDNKITQNKKRQAELQAIKVQVDQFLAKKRILDAKVKLIEQLRAQQSGPVHLLDEISKALPDLVWLTSMDQTGNIVRLQGESNGLTAVADFISNLQRSGWFPANQVELVSSNETAANVITFQIQAQFQPPAPPTPPAGAPAAAKP